MKKIFLVYRTDDVDYDEYDSCVITAKDKEEVIEIIESKSRGDCGDCGYWDKGQREILEILLDNNQPSEIIIESFNAG